MKTTNTLALANTKYHRGKNLLSGIAIVLTTVLVFLVISIGLGVVNVQNTAVNKIYPTWHAMYRNVSEQTQAEIAQHEAIESYGLRQDVGEYNLKESSIFISYIDKEGQKLNKLHYTEGRAPEKSHEVALSLNGLKALGYVQPQLGDILTIPFQPLEADGLGLEESAEFRLVGLLPDSEQTQDNPIYSMLVAQDFMEEVIPSDQRTYRVMVRLNAEEATSTDAIEDTTKEIGTAFDVSEDDIVSNSDYLFANYIDPNFYTGVTLIVLVILVAGALTIYSIYYVSLINKVQEFGKIKALGATKKQIRQIVLKENLIVAGLSVPIGLGMGMLTVKLFFQQMIGNLGANNAVIPVMREVLDNGEVQLIIPWVVMLTILIALLTVIVASLKPMRLAGKIMPIEAMRYTGQSESKNKARKGFINLNLQRLAGANLSRNKKRTVITIVSLGLLGILFIVVSTVFNCMQPDQIARDAIAEDFRIDIESWHGDKMHPERDWKAIQQNNPFTEETMARIDSIPGVEKVDAHYSITGEIPAIKEDTNGKPLHISIGSINEDQMAEVLKSITEGSATYDELLEGDKLIAGGYISRNYPEASVGSQVDVTIFDGTQTYVKKMTIVAAADFSDAIDNSNSLLTSTKAVKALSENNLTNSLDIKAKKDQVAAVEQELTKITEENDLFILQTYEKFLEEWRSSMGMLTGAGYGILLVLAIVGIMNLVNTTIDSILSRKKELGVMQALGMSTRQMKKILQMESLFYAGGIILLSVGVGSVLGYACYLYAEKSHLLQIKTYHYPVVQVILLILITISVELILTMVTTALVNKETVINRIAASE